MSFSCNHCTYVQHRYGKETNNVLVTRCKFIETEVVIIENSDDFICCSFLLHYSIKNHFDYERIVSLIET